MIRIDSLTKLYGEKEVLSTISLAIEKYKITAFIGPNGAGKSTLLSTIARLESIQEGNIFIDNQESQQYSRKEFAKKIAFLRQNHSLSVRMTVRELVSFGRFPYSQGRLTIEDEAMIDKAIDYMELTNLQNIYVQELSGGQKQRVYLALVLAQDTDYILLDEPLNNLDMKHSVLMMRLLRRLVDEWKKTVIIVIHDINFAMTYSDDIVALKNGKVLAQGPIDGVINEETLEEIYDFPISITEVNGKPFCMYYQQ